MMRIYYGIADYWNDVTDICLSKLTTNNIITIPSEDNNRAYHFSDHLVGIPKKIMIQHDDTMTEYDGFLQIKINVLNNTVTTANENDINYKLQTIHSRLNIRYGSLMDELPEQKMAVRYLSGNEKVLEIGGNIGRNSLVIASILQDAKNLVTLESDANIAAQLSENRDLNNLQFHIECSALSKRKLIQKGWETIPSDTLQEGYSWVNTITYDELIKKYNIVFDTLVLDCEGAFYYILLDMPEVLNNVNLIIMENDYHEISKKNYVDEILTQNNFYRDYVEAGGWGPCCGNFFEVWKRM
jgi:FkbM family methyltransferase